MPLTINSIKTTRRPKVRPRSALKRVLYEALRVKFPQDTVDVSDGFAGNIHILVVSKAVDKLGEKARYSYLWRIVQRTDLTKDEQDLIMVLPAYSPRELK